MPTQATHAPLPTLMQRLADAFAPLRSRGALIDGPAARPVHPAPTALPAGELSPLQLARFVTRLRQLLAVTDEAARRRLEDEVLALAVPLQAAGLFELLHIAHRPLATMVDDHLAARRGI